MALTIPSNISQYDDLNTLIIGKATQSFNAYTFGLATLDDGLTDFATGGAFSMDYTFRNPYESLPATHFIGDSPASKNVTTSNHKLVKTVLEDVVSVHALAEASYREIRGGEDGLMDQLANEIATGVIAKGNMHWIHLLLNGVFSGPLSTSHTHDISGNVGDAAKMSRSTVLNAAAKISPNRRALTKLIVHPAVYTNLANADEGTVGITKSAQGLYFNSFAGIEIIEDETMPATGDPLVYTSYLFQPGVVKMGFGAQSGRQMLEAVEDKMYYKTNLISRYNLSLSLSGVSWIGQTPAAPVAETAFQNGDNWSRVFNNKDISIVKILTKG